MALGGYRPGSGRSKSGYYKGIYCGSTYELCWAVHALDNDIKFTRFEKKLEKDGVIYFPDFLLADGKTIIEPKGYERGDSVAKKTALAESLGYIVKVMRKNDLKYAFDYVAKTYGTKKFHTLYDGYKPKYNYVCKECNNNFSKDIKLKSNNVFCNRICGAKYAQKIGQQPDKKHQSNKGLCKPKLTKEDALSIFHNQTNSLMELAEKYNLNRSAVIAIRAKKTYRWIHEENLEQNIEYSRKSSRKNNKISFMQETLNRYRSLKIVFNSLNEIIFTVLNDILKSDEFELSRTTLFRNLEYRKLLEDYLLEQSKF